MEITARLVANAKIATLKDERKVVNFNVAINDSYKAKGSDTVTKTVTYVQCDYWINPGIAQYLTKGTLVELQGRVGINAYKGYDGEPIANLTLHVNQIKLHGGGNKNNAVALTETKEPKAETTAANEDDLPF